jgi:hypothetical protein
MSTLHDIDKLPLPKPGAIGLRGFQAWIELARPVLEQDYMDQLPKQQKRGWKMLVEFGQAGFPSWDGSYHYDLYRELQVRANRQEVLRAPETLTEEPARPTPSPRRERTLEELQRPTGDDFADAVWNLPLDQESTEPVRAKVNTKEKLRQHYLALLLPELEKRAPAWWKVLSVLHEKSPEDLSFFELSTWSLAKKAGVAKESVRSAVVYLQEKKLVEVKHGLWDEDPTKAVRPKYRLLGTGQ